MMKTRSFLLILILLLVAPGTDAQDTPLPPADYRRLPDLPLFVDEPLDQWAGAGDGMRLETVNGDQLPLEDAASPSGGPAYRLGVEGGNGWWSALLAGRNWTAYSVAPYVSAGALQFDVRGAAGGEDLKITFNDVVPGRNPENLPSAEVILSDVVSVTQEWQPVRIPLRDFLASAPGFNVDQLFTVVFSGVHGQPQTIWLSNIRFSAPVPEPASPAIKLNQTGYLPAAPKVARISGFDEALTAQAGTPFTVRELHNNQVVYSGALALVATYDGSVSGERVLAADFSDLTAPGTYYLSVDAYQVADSPPFAIGSAAFDALLVDVLRYFFLQRAGMPLTEAHAGLFARPAGHPQDARAALRSGLAQDLDVAGGWYDAGDYGKYVNAGATAVSDLLWTFEMFPDLFADGQLNIPESGNGVADLLDEARWELDWLLRMQDRESGGFYYAVQPTEQTAVPNARGARFIEDVDGARTQVRPTSSTASAVAALAHGALVFAAVDPDYAAALLAAAERGWAYLQANPQGVAPVPGPYSDADDSQERLWAAAVLFRVTADPAYHTYFRSAYGGVDSVFESESDNAYGVGNMEMIAWLHYAHSEAADPMTLDYFRELYTDWLAQMNTRREASAWSLTLLDEDFYWGSNYVALTTPLVMFVGARGLGLPESSAQAAALAALDYLLGTNPLRFSYISGYGEDSVQHPVSAQWSHDDVAAIPAGVLVGGPNEYTNPLLYSNFPARRYVDGAASWTVNEHTVYWNAALLFAVALAADEGRSMPLTAGSDAAVLSEEAVAPASDSAAAAEAPAPANTAEPPSAAAGTAPLDTAATEADAAAATGSDPLLRSLFAAALLWLIVLSVLVVFLWRRLQRR